MSDYDLDIRVQAFHLNSLSKVALARDLLWDVLRNEGSAGGWSKEDITEAWQALEKAPEHYEVP